MSSMTCSLIPSGRSRTDEDQVVVAPELVYHKIGGQLHSSLVDDSCITHVW